MFLKIIHRNSSFSGLLGTTRQRVLIAALALAAIAVACGSADTRVGGIPQESPNTPAPTSEPITSPDGSVVRAENAAPSFVVETFAHGTYDLNANVGRPVLINFWFPSCPPCRAELPDLQAAYEDYGDEIDFLGVQQISVDTVDEGIEFLGELGITYPNFADKTEDTLAAVQRDYQILAFPTTVFLNRDHSVSRTWSGIIREKDLEEQIEKVIAS